MRRILPAALICLVTAFPVLAQRGGHSGGGHSGGGGMRGGGGLHGGGMRSGGFGGSRGGFRSGFGHRSFHSGFGFRRFGTYPWFYGGFGYYDPFWYDSYPYSNAGYASADYGYQSTPSQAVIINQEFQPQPSAPAVLREYVAPGPPATPPDVQRQYGEALYLIAFNGGVIRAVVAYWAEGPILHYVTMDHVQKQVPLASIDRALSERLNNERNVPFQLPR